METHRFMECYVTSNTEGDLVPLWECELQYDKNYLESIYHSTLGRMNGVLSGIYDLKKKKCFLKNVILLILKPEYNVGQKVAYESDKERSTLFLSEIVGIERGRIEDTHESGDRIIKNFFNHYADNMFLLTVEGEVPLKKEDVDASQKYLIRRINPKYIMASGDCVLWNHQIKTYVSLEEPK